MNSPYNAQNRAHMKQYLRRQPDILLKTFQCRRLVLLLSNRQYEESNVYRHLPHLICIRKAHRLWL